MDKIRLNKYLALNLGVSRREADDLIDGGRVTVNGEKAALGKRIESGDEVLCDARPVKAETSFIYIALNKPVGYVSSRKRQGETPTLYELLPEEYRALKTVGRLDKDSSGLILLTNDGYFAYEMTHPKFVKEKKYVVGLDQPLAPLHQQMIADFGLDLVDGKSQLGLERLDESRLKWMVTMSEGRNRQIRRTFAALGYTVVRLHRVKFGTYELGELREGETQVVKKK